MEATVFSVSEINFEVKQFLEGTNTFKNIFVQGEISNITYYSSGHLYFTLKDAGASVKCAIFRYKYRGVPVDLKEGEQVKIRGNVTLYERNGSYQIVADFLERTNSIGSLYEKMEMLKRKYYEKGYFDNDKKKLFPKLPMNIGVVTAATGAAIRDIINTAHKRFPNVNIFLYPAKVQGDGAVQEIVSGIEFFNRAKNFEDENKVAADVIIVGRGGGSIEDLWAFNEEAVIEAIYKSEIPIISSVGHEIDNLLSDLVADRRAATPTQAAEILIPEKQNLIAELENKKDRITKILRNRVIFMKKELEQRKNNYYIKNFVNILDDKKMELIEKEKFLVKELKRILQKAGEKLEYRKQQINKIDLKKEILNRKEDLIEKEKNINFAIKNILEEKKKNLQYKKIKVSKYSVQDILNLGYTITRKNGRIVKRGIELSKNEIVEVQFKDARRKMKVD
jgi:exodeoxyribonuclease VII, large subunit